MEFVLVREVFDELNVNEFVWDEGKNFLVFGFNGGEIEVGKNKLFDVLFLRVLVLVELFLYMDLLLGVLFG